MNNGVTFRRIHGHIIPIKINDQQRAKQAAIGSVQVGTGAVVAAATGAASAHIVRKAADLTVKSRVKYKAGASMLKSLKGQLSFSGMEHVSDATKAVHEAVRTRAAAGKLFKSRNALLLGGAAVAAPLLAEGFGRLREAVSGRRTANESASKIAGVAAATGVYAAYYTHLPVGGVTKVLQNTAARLKNMPRPHQAKWFKGG